MLYRVMPKTNDNISALGYGCMRLPGSQGGVDEKKAIHQIRYAIDRGINYLDTAWMYHSGKSETVLGKALKEGYREKVKIADKLPHWLCKTPEDMNYYLDSQLKRLEVESIDYYLIHALDYDSWRKAVGMGIIDFMDQAKKKGIISNIGFSFHGLKEGFKKIIDEYNWDFCQIQLNILDEHFQAGVEGLQYAAAKKIGVIIMEPLRGGSLAGKLPRQVEQIYRGAHKTRSNAEWALRWVWNLPGIITVLSGMNSLEQIDENIKIASEAQIGSLSKEETDTITRAAQAFRSAMKVPCTSCQYCMPCPKNVSIPSAFTFYNNKYLFKQGFMSRCLYLLQLGEMQNRQPALASQCVQCGKCVKHCPQSIDIPAELKKVEKEFEGFFTRPIMFLLHLFISNGKRKK